MVDLLYVTVWRISIQIENNTRLDLRTQYTPINVNTIGENLTDIQVSLECQLSEDFLVKFSTRFIWSWDQVYEEYRLPSVLSDNSFLNLFNRRQKERWMEGTLQFTRVYTFDI